MNVYNQPQYQFDLLLHIYNNKDYGGAFIRST